MPFEKSSNNSIGPKNDDLDPKFRCIRAMCVALAVNEHVFIPETQTGLPQHKDITHNPTRMPIKNVRHLLFQHAVENNGGMPRGAKGVK